MSNKHVFCQLNITFMQFSIVTCTKDKKIKEFEIINPKTKKTVHHNVVTSG
jgi:hypothetical protein